MKRTALNNRIELLLVQFLFGVANLLPRGVALALGRWAGWFMFHVLRIRRNVVLANLRYAFGDSKTPAELQQIAAGAYENVGMTAMEFARFPRITRRHIAENFRYEDHPGWVSIRERVAARQGAVLVAAHFSSWETGAVVLQAAGLPVLCLAADLHNPLVNRFIRRMRLAAGVPTISVRDSLKPVFRALDEGMIVVFVADQDARAEGITVRFFGRPTQAHRGPAVMALKRRCPIYPAFNIRERFGVHRLSVHGPLWGHDTGNFEEDVRDLTQRYFDAYEEMIRHRPDLWFWLHRRWKDAPVREAAAVSSVAGGVE
ncbi:MAG: hypothetical protein V1809_16810 [Planctomycetota bacterium]